MDLSSRQRRILREVRRMTKGGYRISLCRLAEALGWDADKFAADLKHLERFGCIDRGGLTQQIGFVSEVPSRQVTPPKKTRGRRSTDQLLSDLSRKGNVRLYTKKNRWVAELNGQDRPHSAEASTAYAALYKLSRAN